LVRSIALAAAVIMVSACGGGVDPSLEEPQAAVPAHPDQSGRVSRAAISSANACSAPSNPVVAENCLPGSPWTEWDITGNGDPRIQGFATDISYNRGDLAAFKIDTDARSYRIEIYRLGYYGGDGARKVAAVSPSATLPQSQPSCLADASTGLVDCGNWAVSATWRVPVNAVSGVYVAKLTRDDTGGASHIRFVVRDDASHSDLFFQTSDTTWQAYNYYGGNSLYRGGPAPWGAYKVSYNRPLLDRGDPYHAFFVNEYPMVRWLEANGFDVSYTTGVDTHRRGALIRNHKVFLSVGHDEYWSGQQRANVEAARDAGVHLAFFSGNSVYWKTRWENSIDGSGAPYRTLVAYKETRANAKIDPSPEWTGTWRDPRFSPPADGGRPENALQGTFWLVNCCNSDVTANYTIQVSAEAAKLRFWRNTGLEDMAAGQTIALTPGILGFEWDTDIDNGFRPRGLIRLSEATYNVPEKMLDFGSTVGPGIVTHYLTLYRHTSGALVFGAGTTRWSWGLDDNHDGGGTPVDARMRQATVNLFADMGAQPGSLQPGLVAAAASTDALAPTATIVEPAELATVPGRGTVVFSGTATDAGGGRVAAIEISTDGGASWQAATGRANWSYSWKPSAVGRVAILVRAIDDSGNVQATPTQRTIVVSMPDCPCSIWDGSTAPVVASVADRDAVEVGIKFSVMTTGRITGIRFYKGTQNGGTHIGNLWTSNGQLLASAVFASESVSGWQQVDFAAPVSVRPNTTYVASYFAPQGGYAADASYFASPLSVVPFQVPASLTVGNGVYSYGPSSRFPTNSYSATNYWVDVVFVATSVSASDDQFTLNSGQTLNVPATGVLANDSDANGSPLTASLVSAPRFGGLVLTADGSFSYTPHAGFFGIDSFTYRATANSGQYADAVVHLTVNQSGCPCSLFPSSAVPQFQSVNDFAPVELGVKFSATVPGYVTGVRFYKGTGNAGLHIGNLWTTAGQRLARTTFHAETAIGWQQANFDVPVAISPSTTYIVSYFAPQGGYAFSGRFFQSGVDSNFVRAPDAVAAGGNGVYAYSWSGSSVFPSQTYDAANYWVDVVFSPVLARDDQYASTAGEVLSVPAPGLLSNDVDAGGTALVASLASPPLSGTVSVSPDGAFVYTPNPGFAGVDSFTYRVASVGGQSATARATIIVTSPTAYYSVFDASAQPAVVSVADASVELGMKFSALLNGYVHGVRFYKGPANTGVHVGNLWTTAGQLLATATFLNETASGWQQVLFDTPVPISAGTQYVVSYHAPNGGYAFSGNFFSSSVDGGVVMAPSSVSAGGNGVYVYGAARSFPSQTWQAGNYWVDVLFKTTP
jgi:hypothetical protein